MNIVEAMDDPVLFEPWFRDPTSDNWRAILRCGDEIPTIRESLRVAVPGLMARYVSSSFEIAPIAHADDEVGRTFLAQIIYEVVEVELNAGRRFRRGGSS
jgi:hypothetical protein